jgi:hypothetical protein
MISRFPFYYYVLKFVSYSDFKSGENLERQNRADLILTSELSISTILKLDEDDLEETQFTFCRKVVADYVLFGHIKNSF